MLWLITIGKGAAIGIPITPAPSKKAGEWRLYNSTLNTITKAPVLKGKRWGEPAAIDFSGSQSDPASATLFGESRDFKDSKTVRLMVRGSGRIRINLYYTYNGAYRMLSKEVNLDNDWILVKFDLSKGLEFGLGMPSRPDVIMPMKLVISSSESAKMDFSGAYIE